MSDAVHRLEHIVHFADELGDDEHTECAHNKRSNRQNNQRNNGRRSRAELAVIADCEPSPARNLGDNAAYVAIFSGCSQNSVVANGNARHVVLEEVALNVSNRAVKLSRLHRSAVALEIDGVALAVDKREVRLIVDIRARKCLSKRAVGAGCNYKADIADNRAVVNLTGNEKSVARIFIPRKKRRNLACGNLVEMLESAVNSARRGGYNRARSVQNKRVGNIGIALGVGLHNRACASAARFGSLDNRVKL